MMKYFTRNELLLLPGLLIGGVIVFLCLRSCDKTIDRHTMDTTLPPDVQEKIVLNPDTHKLTIITAGKEQTLFLPDRPSSIEISKKGTVNVTSKQFGTELKPFFGVQMSNQFRVGAGLDFFYFKKLDLGLGIADKVGNYTPVGLAKVSYIVWDNSSLGLTFDTSSHIGLMLSVRL